MTDKERIIQLENELDRIRKVNIAFIKKVAYLRDLQASYFKTRDKEVLRQSCALEKEVDEYIRRCFDRLAEIEFDEKVDTIAQKFDATKTQP